ncbi:MAG: hypothetical protein FD161_2862 [Limisphaerales bacterium]|nr:MAG: hypothetical protein FD161_2862 [Limisphaerales bacterium]KAG0508215.1 MAG: hypothetical protein E1N63_2613 [Limisphaerales bacterium]TXT51688.1 MAG: hypothetical protein FD140_1492 [Limisphaerales bacterium]
MDKTQLHTLASDFLEPLISGAKLQQESASSTTREALVGLADPCTLHFKAERKDTYRLVLRRSQPFERVNAGTVTESDVVEAFVKVVKGMKNGLTSWYQADLRATFPRRVVAKALCGNKEEEEAVLAAIDQLSAWGGQQYEGKPIPAAVGFLPGDFTGAVSFQEMCHEGFSAVVSNGFDTLLTCNFKGQVLGHETLGTPATAPQFAPYRLGTVAGWATDGRIALVLNRAGEILIFRDKELRFARRGGQWHFLTHAPVITQMGRPDNQAVRRAVYETCLDASFARTGACIGVVISNHAQDWRDIAVSEKDHMHPAQSVKTKFLAPVVGTRKFQNLDRRLRQEMVAIDGATLIDHKGTILAVGAILKIPGGSTGGGRLAAAQALSSLGVGIKVSQDGGITGFHDGNEEPKFIVM